MHVNLQPGDLKNDFVTLVPLTSSDFEKLYQVAADPLVWEQHPSKNRYHRDVFEIFFTGALESKGAFLVFDSKTGAVIGSSRYYEYDENKKTIAIGYTFLARDHWGSGYNGALKSLMLNHAFQFADTVLLHVGATNIRSQKAVERLGARKTGEQEMAYQGEPEKNINYVYQIDKESWKKMQR